MMTVITKITTLIIDADRQLFVWINSLAGKSYLFDTIAVIFAEGVVFFIGTGVILYIIDVRRTHKRVRLFAEAAFASLLARFGFVSAIRSLEFRYRPFWYEHVTQLVPHNPYEPSFPSGHAAVMGAFVTILYMLNKRLGSITAVLAIISGITRVVVGVHFPLDILMGFAGGVVSAFIVNALSPMVSKKLDAILKKR